MIRKSTLFLSPNGLSGVLAGVYTLIGAAVVYKLLQHRYLYYLYVITEDKTFKAIIAVALLVLIASVLATYLFPMYKAKRGGEKLITPTARKAFYNFALPLFVGGALCILFIDSGHYGLLVPITLIFYGLTCVNVSKHTFSDVHCLGTTGITLGLLAIQFSGYGLLFWVLGSSVCHVPYGGVTRFKYERE